MRFNARVLISAACFGLAVLAGATEGTFDSKGVQIRYVTEGAGEAVVLIHGWLSDSSMWGGDGAGNTKLRPVEGFQVIAMDCRGHGKSGGPHDPTKYGVEMAEDVVRLLDHLKIKKAHLVGYSMGAFIVGNVAAKHPDRVLSIVYGGQSPLITGTPPSSGPNECEIFAKAVEEGKGLGPYLLAVWPADRPKITLDQANALTQVLYGKKDAKAMALAGLSLDALEVKAEDLAKCKAPCLFIYGSKEPDRLKKRVESLRKVLGHGEVVEVKDADHGTTLIKPEFGAALIKFLMEHRSKETL